MRRRRPKPVNTWSPAHPECGWSLNIVEAPPPAEKSQSWFLTPRSSGRERTTTETPEPVLVFGRDCVCLAADG